jgi:hypothetical protein
MMALPSEEFFEHEEVKKTMIQFACINLYYTGPELGPTFFWLGRDVRFANVTAADPTCAGEHASPSPRYGHRGT